MPSLKRSRHGTKSPALMPARILSVPGSICIFHTISAKVKTIGIRAQYK